MKKSNLKAIKMMLFSYLAVSKILYWINLISTAHDDVWRVISQRLLEQDILIIGVIVFTYFFEHKFVLKQRKWNGFLAEIIIAIGGYLIYCILLVGYVLAVDSMLPTPANVWLIVSAPFMFNMTVLYFTVHIIMTVKERFKKKEAYEYALDIQSANIKIEMLKTLLDDGVLSQEEFDKQEEKLLEMQNSVIKNENDGSSKFMDENKKARLTEIYNKYQVIDWIIAGAVTLALIFGVPNVPPILIALIFVAGFIYTAWTVCVAIC